MSLVVYLYRWRIRAGHEESFVRAWTYVTERLRERGSYGSRLHTGDDGIYYSYAQWPSVEARAQAFAAESTPEEQTAGAEMRAAIEEAFPEVVLQPVSDRLVR